MVRSQNFILQVNFSGLSMCDAKHSRYNLMNFSVMQKSLKLQFGWLTRVLLFFLQAISKDSLSLWLNYLTSQPRAASLLADKNDLLVNALHEAMSRYLGDVKITLHTPDKRDPEFVFYDVTKTTMNVYRYGYFSYLHEAPALRQCISCWIINSFFAVLSRRCSIYSSQWL